MSYDGDKQVLDVLETALGGSTPTPQRLWRQQYDASGNRTSYQTPQRTQTGSYNPRNQITSLTRNFQIFRDRLFIVRKEAGFTVAFWVRSMGQSPMHLLGTETLNVAPGFQISTDATDHLEIRVGTTARGTLAGIASDSDLGPGPLTFQWETEANAPGSVSFSSAQSASTKATFTQPGEYQIRLKKFSGTGYFSLNNLVQCFRLFFHETGSDQRRRR